MFLKQLCLCQKMQSLPGEHTSLPFAHSNPSKMTLFGYDDMQGIVMTFNTRIQG